ncbi:NAD/NADP octopine/nopaline dehydrogenase family protein [Cytobacillus pseudoceanisediminis]|uniref:NAD/NADP octopine/nopaline dehydrogenase family protein n=1 Tax=Cytobacillus pseudoceanisediminis TaxID=3051614 RepID=A0ABZ2ZGY4_9BACI|nr:MULTISPECIES: NAD/NADP-dependent octopine/nopaline dehydrogenase family protein [Cytobacillus]UQX55062.1 NAD/NADP octopine/nopaline dehydrogenase family protein [Cytobacillus pseudoceanisediminis]
MSYAIIGAGNTGQAIAGYLSLQGEEVKLYSRDSRKAELISRKGLTLKGVYSGKVHLKASVDLKEVIDEAEFIIISTTAFGHRPIFNQLKPLIKANQTIVIFPGYWGAVECKEILGEEFEKKNITIAETSAMPFVSKADYNGNVSINKVKKNVQIGSISHSANTPISKKFLKTFPQLTPTKNVFETSINNTNVIIHTPIAIFNASRIDASEEFQFYPQGASQKTVSYIEKIDEERLRIAKILEIETQDTLTLLNEFYESDYSSLYKALSGLFPKGSGPVSLDHRYLIEDIPYGLVPISELGKLAGVKTPYTDAIIQTASLLMERDFRKEGVDFKGLTREDVQALRGVIQ